MTFITLVPNNFPKQLFGPCISEKSVGFSSGSISFPNLVLARSVLLHRHDGAKLSGLLMKLKNNWKEKSLDNLEGINTLPLNKDVGSYLLNTCNQLRKKQLKHFDVEDLRIMIGQSLSLDYLIILAIEKLKDNILSEGHLYEGDLLKAVLTSDKEYWKSNTVNWKIICDLFEDNEKQLKKFNTTWKIRNGWFDSYEDFKNINKIEGESNQNR